MLPGARGVKDLHIEAKVGRRGKFGHFTSALGMKPESLGMKLCSQ